MCSSDWFFRTQKRIHGFICRLLHQRIFLSYLPEIVVITTHELISPVCISVIIQYTLCYSLSHLTAFEFSSEFCCCKFELENL